MVFILSQKWAHPFNDARSWTNKTHKHISPTRSNKKVSFYPQDSGKRKFVYIILKNSVRIYEKKVSNIKPRYLTFFRETIDADCWNRNKKKDNKDAEHTCRAFRPRERNWEKRLLASSCLSVGPSARMEQLGSHWTDFHEIWYESFSKNLSRKLKFN